MTTLMIIILEKYGNLVKNMKMTKSWKTGSGSLMKILATNCVLKKMPAPYGGLYIDIWPAWTCLQIVLEVDEEEVMNLPKQCFRQIGPY